MAAARTSGRVPKSADRGALARVRRRLSSPPRRSEPARVAVVFALATVALAAAPLINASPPPPPVSGAAPPFAIVTTTGSTYSLGEDLGVRPVLVEFMHPDCSHCQSMGAALATAHSEYGVRVRFVTVAIRMTGFSVPTVATVSSFAATYGHTWTYGVDDGTKARDAYGVQGTPTFVFIRADGGIAKVQAGEMPLESLRGALLALSGG